MCGRVLLCYYLGRRLFQLPAMANGLETIVADSSVLISGLGLASAFVLPLSPLFLIYALGSRNGP